MNLSEGALAIDSLQISLWSDPWGYSLATRTLEDEPEAELRSLAGSSSAAAFTYLSRLSILRLLPMLAP